MTAHPPLALLSRARGRGRDRYVLTVYAPVNGHNWECTAVVRGDLPFVRAALGQLPAFATYEGAQQVKRLLKQPEQSELPAVTKRRVPVGRPDAPVRVLDRLGTDLFKAKVYRRTPQGLELLLDATGSDHYALAALERAHLLFSDAGRATLVRFLKNYKANRKRQEKRRAARKQAQP